MKQSNETSAMRRKDLEMMTIGYISACAFAIKTFGDYDTAISELHRAMAELVTLQALKREETHSKS